MPSHLKALAVILVLATIVFAFAKAPACTIAIARADFERRRNLWFAITLAAFLAHDFWILMAIAGVLLFLTAQREKNHLAMYFSLLFAVPLMASQISGFGVIQHFFTLHYGRLLALVVLLPAWLYLRRQPGIEPFGRSAPDKLLFAYMVLQCVLMLSASTFTNVLRHGVFYSFIDIFLPYYVASRGIRTLRDLRDALMSFTAVGLLLAVIAVFELLHHWLLYAAVDEALGVAWGYSGYLEREPGLLRAQGPTGQPIPLGYALAVALGVALYARTLVRESLVGWVSLGILATGLVASISRGPWVGALLIVLVYAGTGQAGGRRLLGVALTMIVIGGLLLLSPLGESVIGYLPFVGTIESENISFRQRLLEIAVGVILQNPFFGAYNYIYSPAFQELKHGSAGFIDVVNTYVAIGLASGLTGLSLFCSFFAAAGWSVYRTLRSVPNGTEELQILGRALFATLIGILVIIFTVSSISIIPLIYWTFAGICVSYARTVVPVSALARQAVLSPSANRSPSFSPVAQRRVSS